MGPKPSLEGWAIICVKGRERDGGKWEHTWDSRGKAKWARKKPLGKGTGICVAEAWGSKGAKK